MANPGQGKSDIDVLLAPPHIFKVAGEELRMQALPIKRLLQVVKYVQDNADLLDKLSEFVDEKNQQEGKKLDIIGFLDSEIYRRLNGLVRLLFDKATAEKLTDEWCGEHLSNAHYAGFIRKAIEQNELDWLFQKARELMGAQMGGLLRTKLGQGPGA